MAFGPGDVLYIRCDRHRLHGADPKPKYLVCVDRTDLLFFFINSDPYRKRFETQVELTQTRLSYLTKPVCYIDTRSVTKFRYGEIETPVRREPWRVKGALPDDLIEKTREAALAHGLLFEWQEEILRANF